MIIKLETSVIDKVKTIAFVKAYNNVFEVEFFEKEALTIKRAEKKVKYSIVETAMIISLEIHLKDGITYIENEDYSKKQNYIITKTNITPNGNN